MRRRAGGAFGRSDDELSSVSKLFAPPVADLPHSATNLFGSPPGRLTPFRKRILTRVRFKFGSPLKLSMLRWAKGLCREELMSIDLEQRIRELAYHIWEREGRPIGRADTHWHAAKLELTTMDQVVAPEASIDVPAKKRGRKAAEKVEPVVIAAAPRRRRPGTKALPN